MIGKVIVVLEDGVNLHIRATPRDGQLELASSIVFSEIGDVDTFTYNLSYDRDGRVPGEFHEQGLRARTRIRRPSFLSEMRIARHSREQCYARSSRA